MLWIQFLLQNVHFATHLLASLAFFAVFWLYFDAWRDRRKWRAVPRIFGFLTISLSFLVSASMVETSIVSEPLFSLFWSTFILTILRIGGYGMVLWGIFLEPIEAKPELKGVTKDSFTAGAFVLAGLDAFMLQAYFFVPFLLALVALLYLRRATIGLEFHTRKFSWGLFGLAIAELLSLSHQYRGTSNVAVYAWVRSFGYLWIVEHLLLIVTIVLLASWVWQYLLKRLETQLFMIYTTTVLITFLFITVAFTGLLVKNVQDEVLSRLKTDVKVLEYSLQSKLSVVAADAQTLASNGHIQQAILDEDAKTLTTDVEQYLINKTEAMMIVTDAEGKVLARGEDREKIGDSMSDNPLVRKALQGESSSSVVIGSGVLAPKVWVRSSAPIIVDEKIIGSVLTGFVLDHAFVDGIKDATQLEVSIYADKELSATTLRSDGESGRFSGVVENDPTIYEKVLTGESYVGGTKLSNRDYFGAYEPLTNSEGGVLGMLFVGTPQENVFQTAGRSIELTFLIALLLIVVSVVPSKLISRYISEQLH
jgi:hypothetical protein